MRGEVGKETPKKEIYLDFPVLQHDLLTDRPRQLYAV